MNTLRNKVSLIGRLGAQPEVMTFESGRKMARFTLATNESYKTKYSNRYRKELYIYIIIYEYARNLLQNITRKRRGQR